MEVAQPKGAGGSSHGGSFFKTIDVVRRRPYLLLSVLLLTPPFWPILFFFMPVIIAGVVLVAGFVFVDQASQKQAVAEKKEVAADEKAIESTETKESQQTVTKPVVSRSGAGILDDAQNSNGQISGVASIVNGTADPAHATTAPSATTSASTEAESKQTSPVAKPGVDLLSEAAPESDKSPADSKSQTVKSTPMTGPAMLARAAALRKSKLEAAAKSSGEILFLYGSQTGNAMEVAKSLNAEAQTHGISSKVLALDEKPLHKIPGTTKAAVFVVSSTGDGDPPENCERFHNALKRKTHAPDLLNELHFSVLGLGDSNYTTYMGVPRVFTSRLPELGAKRFYKNCEADEVDGLEDVIDAWKEGLWAALKAVAAEGPAPPPSQNGTPKKADDESKLVGVPPLQQSRIKLIWQSTDVAKPSENGTLEKAAEEGSPGTAANPFHAPVTRAEYMTASWSDRRVIHLEVDVSESGAQYMPGDSLGVLPENSPELVDALLERLAADGSRVFSVAGVDDVSADVGTGAARLLGHVGWPCSLREALLRHCDLTAVARKGLLRVLAEYCSDAKERAELLMLSSRGGRDAYKVQIQEGRPSVLDILKRFPSCKPDLAHLLDSLPPLVARMYSVTCSPAAVPGKAQVALSVVREETKDGRVFNGVCTSWLERQLGLDPKSRREFLPDAASPVSLPVFLKSGGDFRLPGSLESPLLLIGPGTGVAPFRGFLQQRREQLKSNGGAVAGEAWLFFGCRKEDEDFLYKEDLQQFETDGTLTKLVSAFSREGQTKVYVQHKLLQHSKQMASLIQHEKAHVFICGDGVNMAKDVHAALLKVLVDSAGMSEADATTFLSTMTKEKRYVRDIWS